VEYHTPLTADHQPVSRGSVPAGFPFPGPYGTSYAAGIREADVKAIIAYLRSLEPVRHAVPAPVAPEPWPATSDPAVSLTGSRPA
jgi:hypothetical protein